MSKFYYSRLAIGNIRKNAKAYLPYMIACVIGIMIFYIMLAISHDPDVTKIQGGAMLQVLLYLGCAVVGIFSVIFFFYTNSFLMKNRKKELALFNILGMAKRNLGHMMFLETLFTSIISLIVGIAAGVTLGKLAFLAVLKILRTTIPIEYGFSPFAAVITLCVFGATFVLVLLCNLGRVQLSSPMQLLGGSKQGEKEPKTKWILAIAGFISTGIGYYIALTVESPLDALAYFFVAVLLVIVGTFCLFTAGSIAVLKMLRKNKKFYYQTTHFTAISGMLYRMKRNAAGLASICILSTMVLVTVSTTVSMQVGTADVIEEYYPHDIQLIANDAVKEKDQKAFSDKITKAVDESDAPAKTIAEYNFFATYGYRTDDRLVPSDFNQSKGKTVTLYYIALKGSSMEKQYGTLAKDEVLISGKNPVEEKNVKIGGTNFKVKNGDAGFVTAQAMGLADSYFIMVSDKEVVNRLAKEQNNGDHMQGYFMGFDLKEPAKSTDAYKAISAVIGDGSYTLDSKEQASKDIYAVYGGLLFIGVFLGLLFLVAAVLIIYYKQISEGYEDSEHYKIMQKVGMSDQEVKKTIKSQILMVFFLPLIVAIIHMAAAFNMMSKLLATLQLTNIWLFVICTGVTILAFTLVYLLVYGITAREYYKLTKFER